MAQKKSVAIIGAGPGGLSAAMLLAHNGYDVQIFERKAEVGGRNFGFSLNEFTFDLGPTFFMMTDVLEEIFVATGRRLTDFVTLDRIDPLYRLRYANGREFFPTSNADSMRSQMEKWQPGSYQGYLKYLAREKAKYDHIVPCLRVPYLSFKDYFKFRFLGSLKYLDAHVSLFDHLGKYFTNPEMRLAFTFQAKYIGMSPWTCPGTFSILSFIEHSNGVYHVRGGLHKLAHAMAQVVRDEGGTIHLQTPVRQIIVENGVARGVLLENGEKIQADYVVINADFAWAMNHLVADGCKRKYTPQRLRAKKYSCSTFMLYLGLNRRYNIPHHNILFANDYKTNVDDITDRGVLSDDPSFYIQNASITDNTLAPEGKSAIYVLVPVANNSFGIPWSQRKQAFRDKILDLMETRAGMQGLRQSIEVEKMITPEDWENEENIYLGATFNLAHSINQMLIFRPHNRFEEFRNCYLVGGGTHPGSGLPTIYESGNISARLIMEQDGHKIAW